LLERETIELGQSGSVDVVRYREEEHLDEVLAIARAQGWITFCGNPGRAARAMRAPGVTALVAIEDGRVRGFAQAVGDGAISGYLCMLLVAAEARGRGIGKALVERSQVETGVLRLDLLSSDRAMSLYERFPHNQIPGFRLYAEESLRPPDPADAGD
jgi:ribosomal protein S18 acetylase RimI-like enzyme